MPKLNAFMDTKEVAYPCLGALRPIADEPSKPVILKKKIVLPRMGRYTKTLSTPLYGSDAMRRLALESPDFSFDAAHCQGLLCSTLQCEPMGYVVRTSGGHRFCLPVFPRDSVSSSFYTIAGYMVTDDGFVAVARRRTLFWTLLGLLAGTVFVLSYMLLQYGAEDAWTELCRFFSGLL